MKGGALDSWLCFLKLVKMSLVVGTVCKIVRVSRCRLRLNLGKRMSSDNNILGRK